MESRKRYARKFQRAAVQGMKSCASVDELTKELGVTRRCLYQWRAKLDHLESEEEGPRPNSHESAYRKQADRLDSGLRSRWRKTIPVRRSFFESFAACGRAPAHRRMLRHRAADGYWRG